MTFTIPVSLLPTIFGFIGVLIGTTIGPFINHQLNQHYSKRDLIFKRKLDYFEKILETIEKNTKLYKQVIKRIEETKKTKNIAEVTKELKLNRKNFLIMSSPLYLDTRKISWKIIRFVRVEKEIFNRISSLNNSKEKEVSIEQLKKIVEILNKRGNDILFEMKKEIKK